MATIWSRFLADQAAEQALYILRGTDDPLLGIRALTTLQSVSREAITELVTEARAGGATWAEVAEALGVTRQAAQARYSASQ